jgi:hypothetical protein
MTAQSLSSTKSAFDSRIGTVRFVFTSVLKSFLQYWYARQAMFWIPKGWVPYYAEWILSSPFAPIGAVSITMWLFACGSVIALVGEAVVAIFALTMEGLQKSKLEKAKAKVAAEKKAT